jgi:hypothetical protein
MEGILMTLLAAVILGGVFGSAEADVESVDDNHMVLDVKVEVIGSAEAVVAHLSFRNEPTLTLPLLNRGDGIFGLRTELQPKNYIVVFETIGARGESSEPVSLAELGADLRPPDTDDPTTTTAPNGELSDQSRQMLWLAIAFGAASLSLLAFWVLGGRSEEDDGDEEDAVVAASEEE